MVVVWLYCWVVFILVSGRALRRLISLYYFNLDLVITLILMVLRVAWDCWGFDIGVSCLFEIRWFALSCLRVAFCWVCSSVLLRFG